MTSLFKILAKINKFLLPSFTKNKVNIAKLNKLQKGLLAWRYFVTVQAI